MSVDENELKVVYRSPEPDSSLFRPRWIAVVRYASKYDQPGMLTRVIKPTSFHQLGYLSYKGAFDAAYEVLGCAMGDVRAWIFEIGDPLLAAAMEQIAGRNR